MLTPKQADAAAEQAIADYAAALSLSSHTEVRQALEMLISKAARGIEKYCGAEVAVDVLTRTSGHLMRNPMAQQQKQ